jgi:hypothetical protein
VTCHAGFGGNRLRCQYWLRRAFIDIRAAACSVALTDGAVGGASLPGRRDPETPDSVERSGYDCASDTARNVTARAVCFWNGALRALLY